MKTIEISAEWTAFLRYLEKKDVAALEEVYAVVTPKLRRKILWRKFDGRGGTREGVQDLVQEAVNHAWGEAFFRGIVERPDPKGSFVMYLFWFASNFVNRVRRRWKHHEVAPDSYEPESEAPSPADEAMEEEQLCRVREVLRELPAEDCELYRLHYVEGKNLKEIGAGLGITGQAVGQRLQRLRSRVEQALRRRSEGQS